MNSVIVSTPPWRQDNQTRLLLHCCRESTPVNDGARFNLQQIDRIDEAVDAGQHQQWNSVVDRAAHAIRRRRKY
jgi:hypothetical protein